MARASKRKHARVLILNGDNLLAAGLQSLLVRDAGIEAAAFTPSGPEDLSAEISRFRPDLILVTCSAEAVSPAALLATLADHPAVRMVAVGSDSNIVDLYDRSQVTIKSLADLLALIPGGSEEGIGR
ncbi:MAG TPA: hypothetical protein VGA61_21055 [Anaerolineae bacterium]